MKKLIFGVLSLTLCASLLLSACAKKEETDDTKQEEPEQQVEIPVLPGEEEEDVAIFEYDFSKDGAVLLAYNGTDEEVALEEKPIRMKKEKKKVKYTEEVTDKDGKVTTVEKEKTETTEVPVEYTLIGVDAGAFIDNTSVKKVVVPDTVTTMGKACFQGCTALEEVVLPKALEEIPAQFFYGCEALTTVNIPETVTDIGLFAFGDYFSRTAWYDNLPYGDTIVGDGILLKHIGTEPTLVYGDNIKKIAYYAFLETTATNITFTDSVEDVNALAFYRGGKPTVHLPESSKMINLFKQAGAKVETYAE